jgi:beta-glucanase (GH16 family)
VSGTGCGGTACGTIASSGIYTAPAAVPSSATVTITATSLSDPTKSASASVSIVPPQAAGYNLAWEDTFSTLSLCKTNVPGCNWYQPGYWKEPGYGIITDPIGSYANIDWMSSQGDTVTGMTTSSTNGAYSHKWTFGYFEVSMAFDPTTGSAPALWMLPVAENIAGASNATNGVPYGELDIFEWQSNTPKTFLGTVLVWVNQVNTVWDRDNAWTVPAGTDFAKFNTYGVLWTPTVISWYLNNNLMGSFNTTAAPFNTVFGGSQAYFLMLWQQAGCNQTSICFGQSSPLNMQVQWVHVFQAPSL